MKILLKHIHDPRPGKSWKRFRKNALALTGMLIVSLSMLLAVFCYVLMPDNSPMASRKCLPICNQPSGFKVHMLKVTENTIPEVPGFWSRNFKGTPANDFQIPITSYRFDGTDVIIREYSPAGDSGLEDRFNIADVVYPVNTHKKIIERNGGLFFETMNGESAEESVSDMQKFIEGQYIVEKKYILGTDRYGRDLLSRLMAGNRIAFFTGLKAVMATVLIGLLMGMLAGFRGRRTDRFISWLMNAAWSIPTLLLVIVLTLVTGNVVLAAACILWVDPARLIRDEIRIMPRENYSNAARTLGIHPFRIIFKHVLPNLSGPLLYGATSNFASVILIESGLGFLSINMNGDLPSWGQMIRESYQFVMVPGSAMLTILPGLSISLLTCAFLWMSMGIRDAIGTSKQVSLV